MEQDQFSQIMAAISGLVAAQQESTSTLNSLTTRIQRIEDSQDAREQLERDRELLRTQEQLGQRSERQVYETEARGWIAELEGRATVDAVEKLQFSDPRLGEHFGIVRGGSRIG